MSDPAATPGNAAGNGRYFEHFRLGETIVHATPRTITEGDAALYLSLTGSRHVVHCAKPVAQAMGFKQQPLDDLLVFHIAFGKTVPDISVNAVANLGYADARFLLPVYAGDTLTTRSEVIGLKQNTNGNTGIVYVRSVARNQHDQPVLSWVRWVMVHKQDQRAPAPDTTVPDLPSVAPLPELPSDLNARTFDPAVTGSEHLWEDYTPGQRIDHPAGMTVDNSDHTLATKLYQNNARVHFDGLAMQETPHGQRLMYGGHVISVCRALSYDGLENALLISAINAGTHANPTFAGDTLYCWSEVLACRALPGREDLGAVRLRLLGLKNQPAASLASPHVERDGKQRYHEHVVLDLDYTVLMPRHRH